MAATDASGAIPEEASALVNVFLWIMQGVPVAAFAAGGGVTKSTRSGQQLIPAALGQRSLDPMLRQGVHAALVAASTVSL